MSRSQHLILYVDGACRGNPGRGGWGVLIEDGTTRYQLYGGEAHTTNNRMELCAAIEGIRACPASVPLTVFTDSIYVKNGITQWIHSWKAKHWKVDKKNLDLWQQLDHLCAGRRIDWHWVKGHAGNAGNEEADRLANLGADGQTHRVSLTELASTLSPDDQPGVKPSGNEPPEDDQPDVNVPVEDPPIEIQPDADQMAIQHSVPTTGKSAASRHPQLHLTPATQQLQGKRYLILDTETTGFNAQLDDRIIEIGAVELINRKPSGASLHIYLNPQKDVGDSFDIHGLSNEFLADKPLFGEVAQLLYNYLHGAHLIAHNAGFDMSFLDSEFERAGLGKLSDVVEVTDSLAIAREKHPGQKNHLDALVRRYAVPERDRTYHGALLDAQILADVYLAMTGGQVSLDMGHDDDFQNEQRQLKRVWRQTPLILPSEIELQRHQQWLSDYAERHNQAAIFDQTSQRKEAEPAAG